MNATIVKTIKIWIFYFYIIVDGFSVVGEELEDAIGLFQFKDVPPIDTNL